MPKFIHSEYQGSCAMKIVGGSPRKFQQKSAIFREKIELFSFFLPPIPLKKPPNIGPDTKIGLKGRFPAVKIRMNMATVETVLAVDTSACGQCGGCVAVCKTQALYLSPLLIEVNPALCTCCGDCITICPIGALSFDS